MNYFRGSLVLLILTNLVLSVAVARMSADQMNTIFLRFYVGNSLEEYIDRPLENAKLLVPKMEKNKPTVLYIHGFTESVDSDSVGTVMRAYLQRNDHNVLALDYRKISNEPYARLAKNAGDIGTALALALNEMVEVGLDWKRLHIVGHSMGSQVAGHVGRKASFQVQRITGLDPAGPFFNFLEAYLSSADARFVDIIHTDYGIYGIARTSGTVDFFPNGGHRLQPGCPQNATFFSIEEFCSHRRSWAFYAESLIDEGSFVGVKCSSHVQFVQNECEKNERVIMGYGAPSNAKGSVYLATKSESPYGLREEGATAA